MPWIIRRYHAATEPIWREIDQLNLSLALLRAYLKGARGHDAPMLISVLERAEADFSERAGVLEKVLDDLQEAERALMQ